MKISELSEIQKQHLVWRLDHKTATGYITASAIARGDYGDIDLVDVFLSADRTLHSAKIHARKVRNFEIPHLTLTEPDLAIALQKSGSEQINNHSGG